MTDGTHSPIDHHLAHLLISDPDGRIVDEVRAVGAHVRPQGQRLHPAGVGGVGAEDQEQGQGQTESRSRDRGDRLRAGSREGVF